NNLTEEDSTKERFRACILLAAVGDAMGYCGTKFEFDLNGFHIHQTLDEITKGKGIPGLEIKLPGWPVSDDTVMHVATAQALLDQEDGFELGCAFSKRYV